MCKTSGRSITPSRAPYSDFNTFSKTERYFEVFERDEKRAVKAKENMAYYFVVIHKIYYTEV